MHINAMQQSYGVQQTPGMARSAGGGNGLPGAASNKGAADTVSLSTQGVSLSRLPPLMLPTRENVQKLSASLSEDLKNLFSEAGINPNPPVEFDVDPYSGKVSVKANRPDAPQIAELIKNNREVEMKIHNVAALSSHVVAMAKAMEASSAYQAAQTPAEIDQVLAKYSSVFNGQTEVIDFSLVFNGEDVQVNADGKSWMSSKA